VEIKRSGSQASRKGPADWFTGTVRIDPLFESADPARAVGASVTFEPGARTAWHTHPLGQTLIVTAGSGRAQRWGGQVEEIRPGDVVWFAPGEKHWHGHRHPGTARRHHGRVDGTGQRRAVRTVAAEPTSAEYAAGQIYFASALIRRYWNSSPSKYCFTPTRSSRP
jgi:quercetin dioxygenase-like cupin family protein